MVTQFADSMADQAQFHFDQLLDIARRQREIEAEVAPVCHVRAVSDEPIAAQLTRIVNLLAGCHATLDALNDGEIKPHNEPAGLTIREATSSLGAQAEGLAIRLGSLVRQLGRL